MIFGREKIITTTIWKTTQRTLKRLPETYTGHSHPYFFGWRKSHDHSIAQWGWGILPQDGDTTEEDP